SSSAVKLRGRSPGQRDSIHSQSKRFLVEASELKQNKKNTAEFDLTVPLCRRWYYQPKAIDSRAPRFNRSPLCVSLRAVMSVNVSLQKYIGV
uniref:Uncharacterized protein n=1 Tax=Petromyzon marinus TaxID=7757 RepID=S4R722_PETMA